MIRQAAATLVGVAIVSAAALLSTTNAASAEEVTPVAPVEVQAVTVEGTAEPVTRDDVNVNAPEPVAPVQPVAEPVDVPVPGPTCEPGTFPATGDWAGYCWEADAPATCDADTIRVEDGSCVPASFFDADDASAYPVLTIPACADEDGTDCYWDASVRGNGQGTSFVNIGGVTYYAEG